MKPTLQVLPTLAALIALTFSPARAANDVWNGGTNDWNTGTNWSAGVPNSTVTGSFSGSANPNVTLSSTGTISGITFNTSTAYTIGTTTGPAIILTNGAVTSTAVTDAAVQTINAPLIIGTGSVTTYIFQSNSSTAADVFNIGGSITGASAAGSTGISFAGSNTGTNTVSGVISDGSPSDLTSLNFNSATSNNIWDLTAANTYSGGTTTGGFGTLMVGNNLALGSGTLTLTGSGVIQGDGAAHTLANTVLVNSGIIGGKSNLAFTGSTTFAGTGGALTVNNTGSTTLAGNVYLSNASGTAGSASIFAGSSANLAITGTISNFNGSGTAGALNITVGTGSNITISAANTYGSGATTTINGGNGSVVINNNSAFGSSTVSLGGGATFASGSNSTTIANNVNVTSNANFVGSNNLTVGGTTSFALSGKLFANESSATLTLGNVNLSTTGSSAITTDLVGPGSTTISGVIADGSAANSVLSWGGSGTLSLSGHTTSTGAWFLNSGTVVLNDATDTGNKIGSGTLGFGGANVQLAGNGTATTTLTGINYDLGGQGNISRTGSGSETINLGVVSTGFTSGTGNITAINYQSGIATTTSDNNGSTGAAGIYGGYATVGVAGAADWAVSSATTGTSTIVAYSNYTALPAVDNTFGLNYVVTNSFATTQTSVYTLKLASNSTSTQTLTLGGKMTFGTDGGILDSAQGGFVITGGTITLSSQVATSIQQYGLGTLEIDSQILGAGGLYFQKAGPGTLLLTGTNAWATTFSINSGTVSVSSDANLGGESGSVVIASSTSTGTVVTLASPAPSTLVVGSSLLGATVKSVNGTTVTLSSGGANQTISTNTSANYAVASALILNGGTLEATGSFALSETGATVQNRTISLGADGGTFQVDGTNTLTAPGAISNLSSAAPGSLTKTGTGKLILSAANSYSGGTYIDQGTIQMGIASALGTASLTNGVTINGGTLDIDGFSPSLGNLVLQGNGSIINSGSTAAALNAYSYNFQSGSVSATLADNSSGATAMTKSTSGTVTLNNGNTYSGGTTVVGGKLVIANGSVGSATGSGLLSVLSTGTITGVGTSTAANFNIAGTVIAGSGLATDTTGQTTITGATQLHNSSLANATLEFNLATNSRNSTTLNVGSTGVDFASTNFSLSLVGTNFISAYTPYVLVAGINSGNLIGVDGSQYTGFTTDASGADGLLAGQYKILSGLNLSFTNDNGSYANSFLFLNTVGGVDDIEVEVVPEPSTWALMFGGLVILVAYQRRKLSRSGLAK